MSTLIFDFDGTLADSFELALAVASELTNIARPSDVDIDRLRRLPLAKVIQELHIPLVAIPKLVLQARQRMHTRINELKPFPGIAQSLQSLNKAHRLLVMSSNSEVGVRQFLSTHNFDQYFEAVYGNVPLFNKALALRRIIKKEKLTSHDCYYIGDEVRDIIAARKVGIKSIAVTWGFQAREALIANKPDFLVEKPIGLTSLAFETGI